MLCRIQQTLYIMNRQERDKYLATCFPPVDVYFPPVNYWPINYLHFLVRNDRWIISRAGFASQNIQYKKFVIVLVYDSIVSLYCNWINCSEHYIHSYHIINDKISALILLIIRQKNWLQISWSLRLHYGQIKRFVHKEKSSYRFLDYTYSHILYFTSPILFKINPILLKASRKKHYNEYVYIYIYMIQKLLLKQLIFHSHLSSNKY